MDQEEMSRILSGLVRVGTVVNVDTERRRARVKYQSEGITSGWLYIVTNQTDDTWMPKVDAAVLTVYLPVFNADGFILGEIRA